MAVQIEAPETINLIEALKHLTGETTETAVTIALRERLDRLRDAEDEVERQAAIDLLIDQLATYFRESDKPYIDHGDLLYGEDGLPK
jgi:hypothetical protein